MPLIEKRTVPIPMVTSISIHRCPPQPLLAHCLPKTIHGPNIWNLVTQNKHHSSSMAKKYPKLITWNAQNPILLAPPKVSQFTPMAIGQPDNSSGTQATWQPWIETNKTKTPKIISVRLMSLMLTWAQEEFEKSKEIKGKN